MANTTLPIRQTSVFSMLPSELILDILDLLDIVSIFRFLDTCRYHRSLLLGLPEVWRKVRFVPLSGYTAISSSTSSSSSLLAPSPLSLATQITPTAKIYQKRAQRTSRQRAPASDSRSGSESEESEESHEEKAANGIRHSESERDRDRGGSRSLISEIYAVLRRFRKENGLVDLVREIYMDGTDSPQFPSPLVMLVKFPHLQVLSSRYRRKQTSLTTDAHTLKDMLRNGDIMPHSLKLRRWDIFHPYMTKEDVNGFKQMLDAISIVGAHASETEDNKDRHGEATRGSSGVLLDIHLCAGPLDASSGAATPAMQPTIEVHVGGGMHWSSLSAVQTATSISSSSATQTSAAGSLQLCSNIVWVLEKCPACDSPQKRCWKCELKCSACNSVRTPPSINHQAALVRERARTSRQSVSPAQFQASTHGRPITPPGSISLSQMANPLHDIRSAHLPSSSISIPTTLARPAEFSFFD